MKKPRLIEVHEVIDVPTQRTDYWFACFSDDTSKYGKGWGPITAVIMLFICPKQAPK